MGVYTEYMTVYDGICQVVRIPDGDLDETPVMGILSESLACDKYMTSFDVI